LAPRLESVGCACADESCARSRGRRGSTRESHERFQVVRQPRFEPAGGQRIKSKALGAPWKHAVVMEGSGCAGDDPLCRRGARVNPWPSSSRMCSNNQHPLPYGRGSAGIPRLNGIHMRAQLCRALLLTRRRQGSSRRGRTTDRYSWRWSGHPVARSVAWRRGAAPLRR
jgi:hypothetical protein